MQNNFINKFSPSVRIIVFILLIMCLLLAKSIYLILFITVLAIILAIITDKKVNIYVKMFKKLSILLLIILLAYIIIFREYNIILIIRVLYKLILSIVLIKIFLLNMDFRNLHEGLYGILLPLKRFSIDLEKFSLDLVLSIYFIKFLGESNEKIRLMQILNGKKKINLKGRIFPMIIYAVNQLENLQDNLKIKLYKLNYRKINIQSKIILMLTLILFIVCIFREVIL